MKRTKKKRKRRSRSFKKVKTSQKRRVSAVQKAGITLRKDLKRPLERKRLSSLRRRKRKKSLQK